MRPSIVPPPQHTYEPWTYLPSCTSWTLSQLLSYAPPTSIDCGLAAATATSNRTGSTRHMERETHDRPQRFLLREQLLDRGEILLAHTTRTCTPDVTRGLDEDVNRHRRPAIETERDV